MKNDIQKILSKEVDRRDFLKHVGLTMLALTGVAAAAKTLTSFGTSRQSAGYSSGVYGGNLTKK